MWKQKKERGQTEGVLVSMASAAPAVSGSCYSLQDKGVSTTMSAHTHE